MKRLVIILVVICFCIDFLSAKTKVLQSVVRRDNKSYIVTNNREYEVIPIVTVEYNNLSNLQQRYNVIRYNKLHYADIEVPSNLSYEEFISILEVDTNVSEIIYNSKGEYNSLTPNDTYWSNMWHLVTTNVTKAWDITMGNPSVKVAVLDSGTDWVHPDLGAGNDYYQNIFCNQQENDWTYKWDPTTGNHIDDDNNGYIDDYKGWNFDLSTNDSRGTYYHGTFVAGIIGAKTNNNIGVAGVAGGNNASGVSIIPYCVGMTYPNSSIIDDAIIAAVDNGARIIQFSLGVGESNSIRAALLYAKSNNVVVVCASGNDNSSLSFPASDTTVIAVGATTTNNQRANFSNYGTNLRIMAPGVDIYGLNLTSEVSLYKQSSGTSFAAPQVSGVIALMLSVNPYLTRNDIIYIIESTTQKVGGYSYAINSSYPNGTWNNEMGYGLIDAYEAVVAARNLHPIQGTDYICDTTKYYFLNKPANTTISWSVHNGELPHPQYSIVGASNQDTVFVRCEYVVPALRDDEQNRNGTDFPGGGQLVDDGKWLTATVVEGNDTSVYQKSFRYPLGEKPNVTASSSTTWYSGVPRTFSITNCLDVPDSALVWKVVKKTISSLGLPPQTVTYTYTGRSITYSTNVPLKSTCQVTITATNTLKECEEKSTTLTYTIVRAKQLTANVGDGILNVTISGMDENRNYSLELWDSFYGCITTKLVSSNHEQIDINNELY